MFVDSTEIPSSNSRVLLMGGDLELPEPIIQRIQYFLNASQAARTTFLSKSWNRAWLTRPNIDLDEGRYVNFPPHTLYFPEYVKKTMQRYEESKLKIDSFSLRICGSPFDPNETIVKALEMGATDIALSAEFSHSFFILWNEVFAFENIVRLSIHGFKIDLGPDPIVRCSRLESLALDLVGVKRDANSISNIISRCPLIKDLSLAYIREYKDEYDEQGNRLVGYGYGQMYANGRSLGPLELPKLHNVTRLVLSCVDFDLLLLGDLSSVFPSLKDLTLIYSLLFPEHIRVSSHSLEVLSFTLLHPTRVEFDVPSIRKFTFHGPLIHALTFEPTSREWESHLSVICRELSTSWFLEMSKLVTQLRQSKLHLSLRVDSSNQSFDYEVEELQGLPRLQVENLIMDTQCLPSLSCYALYEGLFRLCRPKFITQNLLPESSRGWKTKNTFLCKTFLQQMNERCSVQTLGMHSLHDLKQVNVQIFDEAVAEWQDISLKSLLVASASPKKEQKIRFGLEWRV